MRIELFGTLWFLASVVGGLAVLIALAYAMVTRQFKLVRALFIGSLLWVIAYSVLMLGASLLTPQQVLGMHQERCFDEMCFSVVQTTTQATLGTGTHELTANGLFYVVNVQLRNASLRTAQKPDHPAFFLDDGHGRQYPSSATGQLAIGQEPTWDVRLQPGETQLRMLVFDAPALLRQQTPQLRLGITEGSWPTPLIIGDENSPWHQKTLIQLTF